MTTTFESSNSNTNNNRHGGSSTGGLSLESMKASSPQNMGFVLKLHIPILYSFLPRFIQQLLNRAAARFTFFSSFVPTWKRRYLILLGGYLYKFDTDNDKSHPKGSPIPLDGLNVHLVTSIHEYDFGGVTINELGLPSNHNRGGGIFYVSNINKTTYYACTNADDAQTWVNSIREGRQETIKRNMGHSINDSYPKIWDHYDTLGKSLTQSKHRIRTRIEQQKLNDMELVSISGGPVPRGYYG
jgi:PH domain